VFAIGGFRLKYCEEEEGDFPDNEFEEKNGELFHSPPGGKPHPAAPGPVGPPEPAVEPPPDGA